MIDRRGFLLASTGAAIAAIGASRRTAAAEDFLQETLRDAARAGAKLAGLVAVLIKDGAASTATYGSSGIQGLSMNGDTVFEIGSITKVLTAVLLADMAARGEVAFDDPVAKYLPSTVALRERGRPITLRDLATYRSGLPNMPGNLPPKWWTLPNPFADYTKQKLYAFLSSYVPEYEPGSHYRYANLGFALLGIALARRAGRSYGELLAERISDPLHLSNTGTTLTSEMHRHLAQGHNPDTLKPAPLWTQPDLPEMGGVLSTANDLTVILEACMGLGRTPLSASFARLLKTRRPTSVNGTDVGLGWFISSNKTEEIVWKTGLTGGFSSFIGFSTRSHRGVILLSNGGYVAGAGLRLINRNFDPGDIDSILR